MLSFLKSRWIKTAVVLGALALARPALALDIYSDDLNHNNIKPDSIPNDYLVANNDAEAHNNINKITAAIKEIYQANGGTLYIRHGTYSIDRPIRLLPGVNLMGYDVAPTYTVALSTDTPKTYVVTYRHDNNDVPTPTCIKNIAAANTYNTQVLTAGWENPIEYNDTYVKYTYRQFVDVVNNYPGKSGTSIPKNKVRITSYDYGQTAIGDEIKILSASNTVEDLGLLPNYLYKAVVLNKTNVGGYWLILDRDLPFAFPMEDPSKAQIHWGINNADKTNDPVIPFGQPAWVRVTEYYPSRTRVLENQNVVPNADYWGVDADGTAGEGAAAYSGVLRDGDPNNKYRFGFTSRNNNIANLILWSVNGNVMKRGINCDSTFSNCIFRGGGGIYGNSCQNTSFTNCLVHFWDEGVELAYCSYNCTLQSVTLKFDDSLRPSGETANIKMGMFNLNERTSNIRVQNAIIDTSGRTMSTDNSVFRICGDDNHFGDNIAGDTLTVVSPYVPNMIVVESQNANGIAPPTNVSFANATFRMTNNHFNNLTALRSGANNVTFTNFDFLEADTATSNTNQIILNYNSVSAITFSDVDMPGATTDSGVGVMAVTADFTGLGITVYRSCTLNGYTGAAITNAPPRHGVTGGYSNTVTLSN